MAGSYVLPQVKVFQVFSRTPNDVVQNLNPFIFGPQYALIRYSDEDERIDCAVGAYDPTAGVEIGWSKNAPTGSVVDPSYASIDIEDAYCAIPYSDDNPLQAAKPFQESAGKTCRFEIGEEALARFARPLAVGDYVKVSATSGDTVFSKIRAVDVGTVPGVSVSTLDVSSGLTVTFEDGGYTGERSGKVTVKVTGDTVSVESAISGFTVQAGKKLTDFKSSAVSIGNGVKLQLGSGVADGSYSFRIRVASSVAKDTITLCDQVSSSSTLTACVRIQHVTVPASESGVVNWVADEDGVVLNPGITVQLGEFAARSALVGGKVYVSQRCLVASNADTIHAISSTADIVGYLGAIHPDNPLAYGVYMAKTNSADRPIYYMATRGTGIDDWSAVLKASENTRDVYAFCPMTSDIDVLKLVQAHIDELSTPEKKQWRIGFVSSGYERTAVRTPAVDGVPTVLKFGAIDAESGTVVVTCYDTVASSAASSFAKFTDVAQVNDTVRVYGDGITSSGDRTYNDYVVVEVVDNARLRLSTTYTTHDGASGTLENPGASAVSYDLLHAYTQTESATAIANASASFYDHRIYNVWPGYAKAGSVEIPGCMLAAAVAGLCCSVQPQQPITNVEIKGVTDVPQTYAGGYSRTELDTIASGGTLIIMQDMPSSQVYVRHQISTMYRDGNLNTTELSITKNLDSISYYFANTFAPYIGRYNVTPELIEELRALLVNGISYLSSATMVDPLIGPQVLAEGTEITALAQHPVSKDKVYATVALNLPAPFNNFDLTLYVL